MVNEIHSRINELFNKFKIPVLTLSLPINDLEMWAETVSARLKLDHNGFYLRVSEFYWALSHAQLAIGYALIARQACPFPKGKNDECLGSDDMPNLLDLSDIHFWYHAFCARECIYRCWERLSSILSVACYPTASERAYFNDAVLKIQKDGCFGSFPEFQSVRNQVKHWNKAASARNKISHNESSPYTKVSIRFKCQTILHPDGYYLPKYTYSTESLVQEIDNLTASYVHLGRAFADVQTFIDSMV